MSKWAWEQIDADRSGSSGDLAKLFKNEGVKQPGALKVDAPSADATLLAREVIQNSWDAASELQQELGDEAPEFALEFEYKALDGTERDGFVESIGLQELAARATAVEDRTTLGLAEHDALEQLRGDDALSILEIREYATTGMYGPFVGAKSKLYLALVSIGFTAKGAGSGGSYGYGKAGLIRGSSTRTVVAYTCFRPTPEEPNVTRRLLGMTYWGLHDLDDEQFTGFARFGRDVGDSVIHPWENEDADAVAEQLGIELRDPSDPEQLGTTFILIAPTVDATELCSAIERNWWPAIVDQAFAIDITDADGSRLVPLPKRNPFLKTFTDAFLVAKTPQDNQVEGRRRKDLGHLQAAGEDRKLGTLGLVSDVGGWSYPQVGPGAGEEGDDVNHRSLVALVRGPRMVVEYYVAGQTPPFVRGAFLADPSVDDLLRQTEPKAHDAWETSSNLEGITDADAPVVAKKVLTKIKTQVNEFRRAIRPPTPKQRDIRLPELENLFRQVLEGKGTTPVGPDPAPRMVGIKIKEQRPEVAPGAPGKIRLIARAAFHLSTNYEDADEAEVDISLRYLFLEDGRSGEACDLHITPPAGFEPTDRGFHGTLGRDEVEFTLESEPYDPDWSGRLVAAADLASPDDEGEAA